MDYKSRFSAVSSRGAWRPGQPRGSQGPFWSWMGVAAGAPAFFMGRGRGERTGCLQGAIRPPLSSAPRRRPASRASPRRRRARRPLLVPCFLARTSPLLSPAIYAAQRASRSRPCPKRGRLYRRAAQSENSQRLQPAYTVSPAGQRLQHRAPPQGPRKPVAGRAPNQPLWGDVRFSSDCFRSTPRLRTWAAPLVNGDC